MAQLLDALFKFLVHWILDARADKKDRKARAIERKLQLIEQVRFYRNASGNREK